MRQLTVSEAATSRTTTKIVETLPKSVKGYCTYAEGKLNKSIDTLYSEVRSLRRFFTVLSELIDKEASSITEKEIETYTNQGVIDTYLSLKIKPKSYTGELRNPTSTEQKQRLNALYNYLEYLKIENLIKEHPVVLEKRESNKKQIRSSKDVKFTGNAKIKTTVDGKYSLIKEKNPDQSISSFVYHVRDEEKNSYFQDDNGELLSIVRYEDAREFVKNLYGNRLK